MEDVLSMKRDQNRNEKKKKKVWKNYQEKKMTQPDKGNEILLKLSKYVKNIIVDSDDVFSSQRNKLYWQTLSCCLFL